MVAVDPRGGHRRTRGSILRVARRGRTGPDRGTREWGGTAMSSTDVTVGFVGLGHMGGPMAANLAKAGYRVNGFDLAEAALDQARRDGVTVVPFDHAAAT